MASFPVFKGNIADTSDFLNSFGSWVKWTTNAWSCFAIISLLLPNASFLQPVCLLFLTHLVESAASLKTNCFSFSDNNHLPPPLCSPHMHWPLPQQRQTREAGRAWYANIAWVGGSREQSVQQCEDSRKPRPQKPVAKQPPAKGREGEKEGPWIQQLLPDLSSHCVNASQPANQSARGGKCVSVRVWGPESVLVFMCVCVCVSVSVLQRERERERERQSLSV